LERRYPETAVRYQAANTRGGKPAPDTGDCRCGRSSFILAFAFVLAGPSLAGSVDNSPGIGTFSYSDSPIVPSMLRAIVVAANWVKERRPDKVAAKGPA
jgi:hypothetical protein